ncbi:hypothetical protein ACFWGA_40150, partial [Amycolatopsis lurida]
MSEILIRAFHHPPEAEDESALEAISASEIESLSDEDLQLSLFLCYGLQYCLFGETAQHWEWETSLIGLRKRLEVRFARELRETAGQLPVVDVEKLPEFLMDLGKPSPGR